MLDQRGFVGFGFLIAVVVGLIVVGGGAYYVIQQQAPTQTAVDDYGSLPTLSVNQNSKSNGPVANEPASPSKPTDGNTDWKTYRNEKFSYELQYPAGLKIDEQSAPNPSNSEDWVMITLKDDSGFNLSFFAGNRPTGAPGEGFDNPQIKKITVAGKEVDEALYLLNDDSPESFITIWPQHASDRAEYFYSQFRRSHASTYVPRIEAIVATLKYTEPTRAQTNTGTLFSHPTDGYSFIYDAGKFEARATSATEFSGTSLLASSAVYSGGGYEQVAEIMTFMGSIDEAQEVFVGAYRKNFSPQVLGTEDVTINGNHARVVRYKVRPSDPEQKFYLIAYGLAEPRTIVATGDYGVIATIKNR